MEYDKALQEETDCPVPECGFRGPLIAVNGHIHATDDRAHDWLAAEYPNAYYPPTDGVNEKFIERVEAERQARKKFS